MQSAVSGLMQAFKAEFLTDGTGWDDIAYGMHLYGSGGISCWGTLCGIPNGCVALLNLIGLHGALGGEALGHYSETEFPTGQIPALNGDPDYGPGGTLGLPWNWTPIADEDVLAKTTSYSPLCHVSISKWCYAAGVHLGSKDINNMVYKNDRCGKICADMAAFTAEMINYYALNAAVENPYTLPTETAGCKTCHWKSGNDPAIFPAQCGLMDCTECHMPGTYHGGMKVVVEDVWTEDNAGNPKDTFAGGDPIVYKVKFAILGPGSCFLRAYRSKAKGQGGYVKKFDYTDTLMSGSYEQSWSDTLPSSGSEGNARMIMKLLLKDYQGGTTISETKTIHRFTIT